MDSENDTEEYKYIRGNWKYALGGSGLGILGIALILVTTVLWVGLWNTTGSGDSFILLGPLGLAAIITGLVFSYQAGRLPGAPTWVRYLSAIEFGLLFLALISLVFTLKKLG